MIEMIPYIDACEIPNDAIDYCVKNEIQTHYQNDVASVPDDGNPFAEWLKEQGVKFTPPSYNLEATPRAIVAINAT